MAAMFKPPFHNFRATLRYEAANLSDFAGAEAVVERHGQMVQPNLALVTGFEDMDMHPLSQIVAVKANPVTVLDENRRHGARSLPMRPSDSIRNVERPSTSLQYSALFGIPAAWFSN